MAEQPQGCARVTGTVSDETPQTNQAEEPIKKEVSTVTARVGQKAP